MHACIEAAMFIKPLQAIIAYTIFEQGTSSVIYRRRGEDG